MTTYDLASQLHGQDGGTVMRWFVLVVSLAASFTPAHAGDPPSPGWIESGTVATVTKIGITVPLAAGTLKKTELKQFDQNGIDLYAQYETADGKVFGTIFVYAPTLPDVGLTFLATDEAIRRRWGMATHAVSDHMIDVAGVKNGGRRVTYEGAMDGKQELLSAGTFVRAGSWIVVGRVTGPADRASEINAGLDSLIGAITFPKGSEPLPAKIIKTEPCQIAAQSGDANLNKPSGAEASAFALVAAPGAHDQTGHSALNPLREVPDRLCLESNETDRKLPMLTFRTVTKDGLPYTPRLYVLYGDAGIMLEVSEQRNHPGTYYVLRHGVGRMYVIGTLDRLPSKAQLKALVASPTEQPVVGVYESQFITPEGRENLTIYCRLTAEGCQQDKAGKKAQSSR